MNDSLHNPAMAEAALSNQRSFREHVHRSVMERETPERRRGELDLAFWPTCQDAGFEQPLIANLNCQRCGRFVAPTAGWWCRPCTRVAEHLQLTRGWSMVRIAASGEYDPAWEEWIQDHAPWLIPDRMCCAFDGPDAKRMELFRRKQNDGHLHEEDLALGNQDRRRHSAA